MSLRGDGSTYRYADAGGMGIMSEDAASSPCKAIKAPCDSIPLPVGRDTENTKNIKSGWYVIQVPTGKETAMCQIIQRVAGNDVLKECFTPRFATEKKVKGQWTPAESLLLPGYVIAVTNDAVALYERLKSVHAFTRLLASGDSFCPLDEDDRAWLGAFTKEGDRVVPMSKGFIEGDKVVVFSGPLKGREGCITSVNRRKSLAYIELDMCGRRVRTRIGLGIVRKRRCPGELTVQ